MVVWMVDLLADLKVVQLVEQKVVMSVVSLVAYLADEKVGMLADSLVGEMAARMVVKSADQWASLLDLLLASKLGLRLALLSVVTARTY